MPSQRISAGILTLLAILLAVLLLPSQGGNSRAVWSAAPTAMPAFLFLAQSPGSVSGGGGGGGGGGGNLGNVLPTSALNTDVPQCSVRTDSPGSPPTCSAGGNTGLDRCTVECDGGEQRCSAFHGSLDTTAFCSTLGPGATGDNACSVLLPAAQPPTKKARCSAGGGRDFGSVLCSASGSGRFQICSVELPSTPPVYSNVCSAYNRFQAANPTWCSVIAATASKAACTALTSGQGKFCSALSGGTQCSVQLDPATGRPEGKCTALRGAPSGTCSVLPGSAGGHCSVINGPAGDPCGAH